MFLNQCLSNAIAAEINRLASAITSEHPVITIEITLMKPMWLNRSIIKGCAARAKFSRASISDNFDEERIEILPAASDLGKIGID